MALIDECMVSCHIYNRAIVDDRYGDSVETYTKGASFQAAIVKNSTTEAIVADKQMDTEIFTVITRKSMMLNYHDVFKRDSDGKWFQAISPAKDSETPARSSIPLCKVTAESWKMPEGVVVIEDAGTGSSS